MQTPISLLNLLHERNRLLVAIAGVAFAVVLIFMNLGFLGALAETASLLYTRMNGDIFLVSSQTLEISTSQNFPRDRLYQVAGINGVDQAMPIYVSYGQWRNPETRLSRALFVFGINPNDPVFALPELDDPQNQQALRRPDVVLMDEFSNPEFGPRNVGVETELERRRVKIGGNYALGGGFAADGTLIVSDQNFRRLFAPRTLDNIDLGVITLEPGTDIVATQKLMREKLPNDVLVLTQEEIVNKDKDFWINTTSTGFIFSLGVTVSFIVGTVIVYQILYTDIRSHLPEYATLKAMGYRNRYLMWVVLQEGVLLALMGYIPGYIVAQGLYLLTFNATNGGLPVVMTVSRAIFVLILATIMCALSALVSVRKVMTTDPAEVFS
jgi:putative ABC transport system permease protein